MKTINNLLFIFALLYSADLFAQTATDLNCTSCVQTTEIANIAITSQKLQGNSVTTAKILDGTITNADISSSAAIDASKISGTAWTSTNDGSGSSLEADLLDGLDGAQFLRSDISGTIAGDLTATGNLSGTGVCIGADCRSTWPAEAEESAWTEGEGSISYSSGNVGIGTTSPASILDLGSGGTGRRFHVYNAGGANIDGLGIDLGGNSYEYDAFFAYGTSDNGRFVIGSHDGTTFREKVTVLGNGNVGIGTSSPNETLEISGSGRMFIGDGGGALRTGLLIDAVEDGSYVRLHPYNYGTGTSMNLVISPFGGGNVGIGTTSPTQAELVVSGSVYLPEDGSYWIAGNSDNGSRLRLHHSTTGNSAYLDYYENLYFRSGESGSDAKITFTSTGNVGIGTMTPGSYKLAVEGTIGARELIVTESSWSDFVFKEDYPLKSLAEVELFIQQNKHLPDIPSEKEVLENGVSVGDMQKRLLQKVEELTLYVIAQDKKMIEQDKKIAELKEIGGTLK